LACFDGSDTLLVLDIKHLDRLPTPIRLAARGIVHGIAISNLAKFAIVCRDNEMPYRRTVYVYQKSGRVVDLDLRELSEDEAEDNWSLKFRAHYGPDGKTLFIVESGKNRVMIIHVFDGETSRKLCTREYKGPELECVKIGALRVGHEDCIVLQLRGERFRLFNLRKVYE